MNSAIVQKMSQGLLIIYPNQECKGWDDDVKFRMQKENRTLALLFFREFCPICKQYKEFPVVVTRNFLENMLVYCSSSYVGIVCHSHQVATFRNLLLHGTEEYVTMKDVQQRAKHQFQNGPNAGCYSTRFFSLVLEVLVYLVEMFEVSHPELLNSFPCLIRFSALLNYETVSKCFDSFSIWECLSTKDLIVSYLRENINLLNKEYVETIFSNHLQPVSI